MSFWKRLFGAPPAAPAAPSRFTGDRPAALTATVGKRSDPPPKNSYSAETAAQFRRAAKEGRLNEVEAMSREHPDIVSSYDSYGGFSVAALHHAADKGHDAIAALLVDRMANINAQNAAGITPLWLAASNGHIGVVKLLLAHGAGANFSSHEFGETALHRAIDRQGPREMIEVLLAHGANVDASTSTNSRTPLGLAQEGAASSHAPEYYKEILDLLQRHIVSYSRKDAHRFRQSAKEGRLHEVDEMSRDHPDIVFSCEDNSEFSFTALHLAAMNGHRAISELLLDRGARIDSRTAGGATPLWFAARKGHVDVVTLLLKRHAQVDVRTFSRGETALGEAVREMGQREIVELLLVGGASVHATNLSGQTPLGLVEKAAASPDAPEYYKDILGVLQKHAGPQS